MRTEKHTRRLRTTLAAFAAVGATLALSFAATPAASATHATSAAPETVSVKAAPHCRDGWVCMWSLRDFDGIRYDWNPDHGNVFLGRHGLADKVASFVSNADGCFQDSPTSGGRGDWYRFTPASEDRDFAFGRVADRIKPSC